MIPGPEVHINSLMRISPQPRELPAISLPIAMGTIEATAPIKLLLEFYINANMASSGVLFLGRIDCRAEIPGSADEAVRAIYDITIDICDDKGEEDVPTELLEALRELTLHRLRNRARRDFSNPGESSEPPGT